MAAGATTRLHAGTLVASIAEKMKSSKIASLQGWMLACISGCLLVSCSRAPQEKALAASTGQPVPAVQYVSVESRAIREGVDLSGKIQPDPTKVVRIYPPASGRVISIAVKPGDHVQRGETLAVLQSTDIGSARADYDKAKIEADRSARARDRAKSLYDHGAAAEKDYIEAQAAAQAAQAELERAQQHLALLNLSPEGTSDRVPLESPISGAVLDVGAAPGEFSKSLESANPLLTIANLENVWVVADVYEKDVAKLGVGKTVAISAAAYPGRSWSGKIGAISDALDPTTRTLKVRVVLPNRSRELKPEMFCSVHVDTSTRQAILVPASAIIHEGDRTTVFVQKNGKPELQNVSVGSTFGNQVEVLSGLQPGDRIAAQGAELLKGAGE